MNRIRRLLTLCLVLGTAPPLKAAGFEPLQRLDTLAVAAVSAQLPPSAQVSGGTLDPRLRLPACSSAPAADPPAVRGAQATVTLRCAEPAWTVYVPVRIRDPRPVVVLARAVARGETLDAGMLSLQERDVAQLPFGYLATLEQALDMEARRGLVAGAVLTPNDAQPQRLVRRGEAVTVVSRSGGIEVRAGGTAMADGARGERIRVRNDSSRRIVEGVVTAAGRVEVRS
jgi:flagellar basal body P-ring formation protein FlgA